MFSTIKEKVDIVEAISKEIGIGFKSVGDKTYAPEDETCPFCGHKDCFRVKNVEAFNSFYHCFSCEEHGDVITFVSKARDLSVRDSALVLAKEWKIQLPNDYSPLQDIFNLAAHYYHTCLTESGNVPMVELNKLTPTEYQVQVRRHKIESIARFQIGWSDGGLTKYLAGLGFEAELIAQSGLANKRGNDFLPNKVFIYPHYVRGRVSHFTFKDVLKQSEYQLKNASKLNNHAFYLQDSIKDKETVIIVEGENDAISVAESGWQHGILATIGQLSSGQLEWIENGLANKDVITFFDSDQAGDKYRDKIAKFKPKFKSLIQVKLSGVKDVDEYLVNGGSLEAAISSNALPEVTVDESEEEAVKDLNIQERNGAYYKFRVTKDGHSVPAKLTNFTIELKNVYIKGQEREREVIVVRDDGTRSTPKIVTSDCKVSLKPFKTFIANAVDASFYGQEHDLIAMWEYIYSKDSGKLVYLTTSVGHLTLFKGWLFKDLFISDTGTVTRPDSQGIVWLQNGKDGLKPISLDIDTAGDPNSLSVDIPNIISTMPEEERDNLLKNLVENLCVNMGNPGLALTMLGWCQANVYSDAMFETVKGWPFLVLWGRHGMGKSSIGKWLGSLFGMDECGATTIPQLKSGVGFSRKIAYYASLPTILDELRADAASMEHYGVFRGWFNRSGRTLGVKESFGVRNQQVKSNFIFVGQDQFTDAALRQRCIAIRIPPGEGAGRETKISYDWIEQNKDQFTAIAYHWILESTKISLHDILAEHKRLDKELVRNGCETRSAKNWACVGLFAKKLADKYVPSFDYEKYMIVASKEDTKSQIEDDQVIQFFNKIEAMMASDNTRLNSEHLRRVKDHLYFWYSAIFNAVQNETRFSTKEEFSQRALKEALKEESYFVKEDRKDMSLGSKARPRVLIFDLTKAPETLQNIGDRCASEKSEGS